MMAAEQPTLVKATDTTEFHPEPPLEGQLRETMQRTNRCVSTSSTREVRTAAVSHAPSFSSLDPLVWKNAGTSGQMVSVDPCNNLCEMPNTQ